MWGVGVGRRAFRPCAWSKFRSFKGSNFNARTVFQSSSARVAAAGAITSVVGILYLVSEAERAPQVVETSVTPKTHEDVNEVLKPDEGLRPMIFKICLTGGPCGGKSTAVSLLTRRLSSLGFTIYIVPEAATLLFTGGVRYDNSSLESELSFEANKIRVQIALEDAFMELAKQNKKPTVIICDRGTMDSRAYIGPDKWNIMLQQNGWTVQQLRDARYDAVFHLVTTAIGAEAFYTNANNATRLEDAKLARELDLKILSAWVGHPKVFIIDNSTDFDGKMNRVVTSICRLLGVPRPKQIDRKFVVKSFNIPPDIFSAKHYTETIYLIGGQSNKKSASKKNTGSADSDNQGYIFLRKRGDQPDSAQTYFYSAKYIFANGESAVVERQISGMEFSMLLAQQDEARKVVRKKVRVFQFDRHYFELEQWLEPHEGLVVLKTSVDTSNERVELPPFVQILREVTDDSRFSTHSLASINTDDLVVPTRRKKD